MKVSDYTKPISEDRGRLTDAYDEVCPCRPCYAPYDFGRTDSQGRHIENIECATRHNHGCPNPLPEPEHMLIRSGDCKRCKFKTLYGE